MDLDAPIYLWIRSMIVIYIFSALMIFNNGFEISYLPNEKVVDLGCMDLDYMLFENDTAIVLPLR